MVLGPILPILLNGGAITSSEMTQPLPSVNAGSIWIELPSVNAGSIWIELPGVPASTCVGVPVHADARDGGSTITFENGGSGA